MAEEAVQSAVTPIYISVGLAWESAEREIATRFLDAIRPAHRVNDIVVLSVDMRDVYPAAHWAIAGRAPGYHTPDEDVYLPGRNIVLLGKAGVYCALAGIERLVLGTLDHNPFPDATPEFRTRMARAMSTGLAHPVTIDAPYARMSKADVIRRGVAMQLPLELTLSCMSPSGTMHCGVCSKCRERHHAFVAVGIADPTTYADRQYMRG